MRIGFIGLGDQGGAMAHALIAAGHDLTVWARRPEIASEWRSAGAAWADTAAQVAQGQDIVALCVTDEAAIREILVDRGLLAAMEDGQILAIHATISPEAMLNLEALAQARGVRLVDAPVSGSGAAVARAALLLLLGGEQAEVDALRQCYAAFCNPIVHVGLAGDATRLKLINNLRCAVDFALAEQTMWVVADQGLDQDMARLALASGTGRNFALEAIGRIAAQGRADHVATILAKDVALALAAFAGGLPADWPELAHQGVNALIRAGAAVAVHNAPEQSLQAGPKLDS